MANVSRVNGFRPSATLNGANWNSKIHKYWVPATDATAIFVGDLVKLASGTDSTGRRSVTKASVGDAIIGSVVNVDYNMVNLNSPQYRPASTGMYVYVADDPETIYEVEVYGTVAQTLAGLNANFHDAGGNTSTGMSGEAVDASTAATTATLQVKILDFVQAVDNDSTSSYAKVFVKINNHQLATGTGTAGV